MQLVATFFVKLEYLGINVLVLAAKAISKVHEDI